MEILKFEDAPKRSSVKRGKNSSRKTILGVAAAAAIAVMGSTLAANISINTGGSLEFGQGITQTTACSGANTINIVPSSSFNNSSGGGTFSLSGLSFSGTGLQTCVGKTFTLKAWDNSTSNPLIISTGNNIGYTSATFVYSSSALSYSAGITAGAQGSNSATVAFNTSGNNVATSGAIYKITLESN